MATDEKNFKAEEDPERAFYLISAAHLMRDYPRTTSLAASFTKELHAMNLRQLERDAKEAAEVEKQRQAEAAKASKEAETSESDSPPRSRRA